MTFFYFPTTSRSPILDSSKRCGQHEDRRNRERKKLESYVNEYIHSILNYHSGGFFENSSTSIIIIEPHLIYYFNVGD